MNKPNRPMQAVAGLFLDLWDCLKGKPFVPHSLLKRNIINTVREKTKADTFIEIGSFLGVTAKRCSKTFKNVHTVELDKVLFEKARANLKKCRNVKIYQGDGRDRIPEILSSMHDETCVIFLDGHFSAGATATAEIKEPAIQELETIKKFKKNVLGIVVDDFRTFGEEKDMPTKHQLLQACEEWFPEYQLEVQFDQVILTKKGIR